MGGNDSDQEDEKQEKIVEHESYIAEYQEIHNDLRKERELTHTRVLRGISAIGVVVGYALVAPNGFVFISFVPILIAIVFILSVQSGISTQILGYRAYNIEESAEFIDYEHFYHEFTNQQNWHTLPILITYLISIIIYILFISISLDAVTGITITVASFHTRAVVITVVSYITITVLSVFAAISWFRVRSELGLRTGLWHFES